MSRIFVIVYQNKYNKQWLNDEYFKSKVDAETDLFANGFVEKGGIYERYSKGWGGKCIAYITSLKEVIK